VTRFWKLFLVCFSLCLLGLQSSGSYAGTQTARLTPLKADRVVVLKGERKLVLMHGDRVLRVFRVALGRYPQGHKTRQGDARTPEGEYTLDFKLKDSAFYRAIHISYPNHKDISKAEALGVDPGGKIMIHGLPNKMPVARVGHPSIDWTQGCIAVTNREMDIIWKMVDAGTPIEIHP
jgi:murein L,D-transpeptidase YafK